MRLREIAEYIGINHNVKIKEINEEPDHVHFVLKRYIENQGGVWH